LVISDALSIKSVTYYGIKPKNLFAIEATKSAFLPIWPIFVFTLPYWFNTPFASVEAV